MNFRLHVSEFRFIDFLQENFFSVLQVFKHSDHLQWRSWLVDSADLAFLIVLAFATTWSYGRLATPTGRLDSLRWLGFFTVNLQL